MIAPMASSYACMDRYISAIVYAVAVFVVSRRQPLRHTLGGMLTYHKTGAAEALAAYLRAVPK
jgi:hypothetical protein